MKWLGLLLSVFLFSGFVVEEYENGVLKSSYEIESLDEINDKTPPVVEVKVDGQFYKNKVGGSMEDRLKEIEVEVKTLKAKP